MTIARRGAGFGAVRSNVVDPVNRRKRSSSRSRIWVGLIERTRAAASSIANAIPSNRSQISPITTTSASSGRNPDAAVSARSVNNSTAAASASDGTRHTHSPPTANDSRLVTSTRTVGQAARASTRAAVSSRTCSQLSSTSNTSRPASRPRLSGARFVQVWVAA